MEAIAALVDSDRLQLRRPFERQIDPVEQGLGTQFGRLTSPADCFDDAGCCECQARETLDVPHSDALAFRLRPVSLKRMNFDNHLPQSLVDSTG